MGRCIADERGRGEGGFDSLRILPGIRERFGETGRGRLAGTDESRTDGFGRCRGLGEQACLGDHLGPVGGAGLALAQQRRAAPAQLTECLGPDDQRLDGQMHQMERPGVALEQQAARLGAAGQEVAQRLDLLGMQAKALRRVARHIAAGEALEH